MPIELRLPLPPSANQLWTRTRKGIRKTDRYNAWLAEAGWTAKMQRPEKITGPYKLSLLAVRPDKRRRDLDNLLKATSDLLSGLGVITDDSECTELSAKWIPTGDGVTVCIEPSQQENN